VRRRSPAGNGTWMEGTENSGAGAGDDNVGCGTRENAGEPRPSLVCMLSGEEEIRPLA
jgi:hypothetical protein